MIKMLEKKESEIHLAPWSLQLCVSEMRGLLHSISLRPSVDLKQL